MTKASGNSCAAWLAASVAAGLILGCGGRSPLPGGAPGAGNGGHAGTPAPTGTGGNGIAGADGASGAGGLIGGGTGGSAPLTASVDVRVRQLPADEAVAEALLLVSDASGGAIDLAHTDAAGNAHVDVPSGGAVSLLRESPSGSGATSRSISSVYDLADGKPLLFLLGAPEDPVPAIDPMTLTLNVVSPPPGAASFFFSVPCWSTRIETYPKLVVEGFTGCRGKSSFDAYVLALDAAGTVIAYGEVLDKPISPGQTVTVDLTADRADFDDQIVHSGPFPSGTEKLTLFMMGYRPGDFAVTPRDALRFERSISAPSAPLDVTLRWPRGHFADFKFGGRIELASGGARLLSGFDRFTGTLEPLFHFDPSALAQIERADVSATNPARPVFDFALSDGGALGDALRLTCGWSSPDGTTTWSIALLPRRSGSIELPLFPDPVRGFAPGTAAVPSAASASHFDDLARSDYWDYLATRVIDDASNLDSTALFH